MLELAILGLLKERPMHGYQLSRELTEQLGGLWKVSYGSLYPTLKRLEREGAVEQVPGTSAGTGRKRLVYRITAPGEHLFLKLLEEPPSDTQAEDARFRIRLAFFRYLPPETRIRLLDRRRAALAERLEAVKAAIAEAADDGDDYQRALMEHGRAASEADPAERVPGLMHVELGGYHIRDVEVVTAFDVDAKKVGKDVSEAIFTEPNNTIRFSDVPPTGVTVMRGRTLDGLGTYYRDTIVESDEPEADVVQVLRDARADVLISYLPVGSEQADRYYAQCAIDANVALVNALPVFLASDPVWAKRFADAGVPIVGDDIKSQVGATITHRVLAKLFED